MWVMMVMMEASVGSSRIFRRFRRLGNRMLVFLAFLVHAGLVQKSGIQVQLRPHVSLTHCSHGERIWPASSGLRTNPFLVLSRGHAKKRQLETSVY